MFEDGECGYDFLPSGEESVPEQVVRKMFTEKLYATLDKLSETDRHLITALFFDGVSLRGYARKIGVTHRTVQKRRDGILSKLKKLME